MLHKVILFFSLLLIIGCQEALDQNEFIITGSISGIENGEFYAYGEEGFDTIRVENGKFEYQGELKEVSQRFFTLDQANRSIDAGFFLWLEPVRMTLSVDANDLSKAKLKGSKTEGESQRLDKEKEVVKEKYAKELKVLQDVSEKYNQAYKAKAGEDVLEAIKEEDNEAREDLEPFYEELREINIQFIKNNPDSYVGLLEARFVMGELLYAEAEELFSVFDESLKKSSMGVDIRKELDKLKSGSPGSVATDISAIDIKGEQFELSDLRGQYVLVDFWASWCVPCRKGNPHLLDLYAKYKDKGFEILGVSDDDSRPEAWKKAVVKDQIGVWKHVLRGLERKGGEYVFDNDISDGYGISTLPTKILINPEGVIIGRYGSGGSKHEELDVKLKEIFGS